mgnify:CR=1 FL=1
MTNETKQTAVEWLVSQLQQTRDWQRVMNEANQSSTAIRNVIEQAKEMEKEQIIVAFNIGEFEGFLKKNERNGSDYYNETYGGNK